MIDCPIEQLHSVFRLDSANGKLHSRRRKDKELGSVTNEGYRNVKVLHRLFRAHRVIFAMAHGRWPVGEIDH